LDIVELLVGVAEISVAMAGFTGVVVAFGSRSQGSWHAGDRLRLTFLLEASLTAAGFSLLALLGVASFGDISLVWCTLSGVWLVFTGSSLHFARRRIRNSLDQHDDVDRLANSLTASLFLSVMLLQVVNMVLWQSFPAFLGAVMLNLAGAAMQFSRLIRSAFRD
jgi:hypothetical protein